MAAPDGQAPDDLDPGPPPDLGESLRQLGATAGAGFDAFKDAGKAFRTLLSADLALARSAFGRTLAFLGVAIAFGASAWLMLMGALVAWLAVDLGWSWPLAFMVPALASVALTAYGAWRAVVYFEHMRMRATRRQLARLGIGELADYTPDAGSPQSTRDATEQLAEAPDKLGKDKRGIDLTPP